MLIWLTKQLLTLRKALTGTIHPRQLAWAVALGVLVGLVPKGNLLALSLIVGVFALNLNHAMFAVSAVACTFIAGYLDPLSHRLGTILLEQPALQPSIAELYALPLVPWTDLNNTVVLGSFLIGLTAVLPTYAISLPLFRTWARRRHGDEQPGPGPLANSAAIATWDDGESPLLTVVPADEVDEHRALPATAYSTQIDVIRLKHFPESQADSETPSARPPADDLAASEVNEALRYLVRIAREKREGKAA